MCCFVLRMHWELVKSSSSQAVLMLISSPCQLIIPNSSSLLHVLEILRIVGNTSSRHLGIQRIWWIFFNEMYFLTRSVVLYRYCVVLMFQVHYDEERIVKQFQISGWSDSDCSAPSALLEYRRRIRGWMRDKHGPLLVHCR